VSAKKPRIARGRTGIDRRGAECVPSRDTTADGGVRFAQGSYAVRLQQTSLCSLKHDHPALPTVCDQNKIGKRDASR
jgi:hypothetical protein